jgi:REP element-mobilizing transposase RayT
MSFAKIYLHCVWSTKNRDCQISTSFRPVLLAHLKEYCKEKKIFLDFINAHVDHVHALISLGKKQTVADIMQLIKGESSFWINSLMMMPYQFEWQDDYWVASVSYSHVDKVREYIKNQDQHHQNISRDEEIDRFLVKNGFERIED